MFESLKKISELDIEIRKLLRNDIETKGIYDSVRSVCVIGNICAMALILELFTMEMN